MSRTNLSMSWCQDIVLPSPCSAIHWGRVKYTAAAEKDNCIFNSSLDNIRISHILISKQGTFPHFSPLSLLAERGWNGTGCTILWYQEMVNLHQVIWTCSCCFWLQLIILLSCSILRFFGWWVLHTASDSALCDYAACTPPWIRLNVLKHLDLHKTTVSYGCAILSCWWTGWSISILD